MHSGNYKPSKAEQSSSYSEQHEVRILSARSHKDEEFSNTELPGVSGEQKIKFAKEREGKNLRSDRRGIKSDCKVSGQSCSSLTEALNLCHIDCIGKLLKLADTDVNQCDESGLTPLMISARLGHLDIVRMLIEAGARVNETNEKNESALLYAAGSRRADCVRELIKCKANVQLRDIGGNTALTLAVKANYPDILSILIDAGADVDVKDNEACTALHWAVSNKSVECVEILIQEGHAMLDELDSHGETPYVLAIKANAPNIIQMLIDAGCDRNHVDGLMGTPLALAALKGHADVIELLIANGDGPDECGYFGMTPLMLAVFESQVEGVDALLRSGADVNRCGRMSGLPLHKCLIKVSKVNQESRHKILASLLRANADVNRRYTNAGYFTACTNGKNCPLSFALSSGYISFVRMLLIAGCRVPKCEFCKWIELNNIRRFYDYKQLLAPICEWNSQPRSLMYLCRATIRKCLPSKRTEENVEKLPLASRLRRYVNFSEFDDIEVERAQVADGLQTFLIDNVSVMPCGLRALEGTLLHHVVTGVQESNR